MPIERLEAGLVRLLATPTMVDEVAAGDVVRVVGDNVEVVTHGGNLGVLFEFQRSLTDLPQLLAEAMDDVEGWVDGWHGNATTCVLTASIPVVAGFPRVEAACEAFAVKHGGGWFFKNVYDEQDRPLNWWTHP